MKKILRDNFYFGLSIFFLVDVFLGFDLCNIGLSLIFFVFMDFSVLIVLML